MKLSIPLFSILATLFADAYAMPAGGVTPVHHTMRGVAPRANPIPGTVFAEAFYLFETSGAESVPREVLGDLLRAVGQNPTQAQVDYMVSAASAQVDYDEFMRTVNRPGGFANEGTKQDKVNRAIEVFDKDGDGKISGPQLHYVLVWLAEKKMGAEQEELIVRAHDLEYKSYLENL